jgi:hypothetical protein
MGNRQELTNDPETAIRTALDGRQAQIWTAMPAIVTKVNLAAMTIECQPAIQGENDNTDGTTSVVNLPLLLDVPIVFPSAGGFILTFPIKVGDEVLIVFGSRCIDAWFQQGGIQPQAEFRMHDLSDAFAIPGPKSQPNVVAGISASNVQLRSNDGTVYLEITPGGAINLVAPSGVKVTGPIEIDGGLTFDGNLTVTGSITASGEVTGNGIALSTHTHEVTSVGAPTGPPL